VNNPAIILADEPTGNLDTRAGEDILQVFDALNADGITIIMVTHDSDVASHCKRLVTLIDGAVVSDVNNAHRTSNGEAP